MARADVTLVALHSAAKAHRQNQRRLLLDVVVSQRAEICQLLAVVDQPLVVRREPCFVFDFRFHVLDGVRRFDVERDRISRKRLHEDLHAAARADEGTAKVA